jgi:hypothetical protein
VAGVPVRTASEFNKLVKTKSSGGNLTSSSNASEVLHVEIVIRRLPFAQVTFLLILFYFLKTPGGIRPISSNLHWYLDMKPHCRGQS